jgi:hypothetical protein
MLATPAMAMHHSYHRHHGQFIHRAWPALGFGYRPAYRAYNFHPGYDSAPGNPYNDFDRRNTFE